MLAEDLYSPSNLSAASAWWWIDRNQILLDGRPFDLASHPYQLDILQDESPRQCFRKGAQIGLTSIQMLKTLHGMIHGRYPQGCLYLFPTRDDVTDFSKGRFTPILQDNPAILRHVSDTDAANIKRVAGKMLYFRGTGSRSQLKSVPVDRLVFDEIDEMRPSMVDLAMERISHSSVKEEIYISTPTIPDYGIDLRWQQSDQRVWMIRCGSCGGWTCLEIEFEERGRDQRALVRTSDGRVIRSCVKCGSEIRTVDGRWVSRFPARAVYMVGWWISQLNSKYVDPEKILDSLEDPRTNLSEFYNSKIGLPYIEATNRLSAEEVLRLCADYGMLTHDQGPCFMGVDQGKDLHVVVGRRDRILCVVVCKDWEELTRIMRMFRVVRCVVDAMPETRNAREFAGSNQGKVFLNYYQEHQKGKYRWNEADMTVACNRTESLDASHREISDALVVIPRRTPLMEEFARHMHNVAKKLEEDEETGSKRYVYVKLGADHFRHAFNYYCIAKSFGDSGALKGYDLT